MTWGRPRIMIKKLNLKKDSEQIHKVMQAAYTAEAELLKIADFYPLNRTLQDISESKNNFLGFLNEDELVGVCELEAVDEYTIMISVLVVQPSAFRKGIASKLLAYVIEDETPKTILVSTAKKNIPAVSLYQKFGFGIYTEVTLGDGLVIVELELITET